MQDRKLIDKNLNTVVIAINSECERNQQKKAKRTQTFGILIITQKVAGNLLTLTKYRAELIKFDSIKLIIATKRATHTHTHK